MESGHSVPSSPAKSTLKEGTDKTFDELLVLLRNEHVGLQHEIARLKGSLLVSTPRLDGKRSRTPIRASSPTTPSQHFMAQLAPKLSTSHANGDVAEITPRNDATDATGVERSAPAKQSVVVVENGGVIEVGGPKMSAKPNLADERRLQYAGGQERVTAAHARLAASRSKMSLGTSPSFAKSMSKIGSSFCESGSQDAEAERSQWLNAKSIFSHNDTAETGCGDDDDENRNSTVSERTGAVINGEFVSSGRRTRNGASIRRNPWFRKVWMLLNDASSSRWANIYHRLMPIINIASVLISLPQTGSTKADLAAFDVPIMTVEYVFEAIYLTDLALRFITCPDQKTFFMSLYNMIDIIAISTLPLRVVSYHDIWIGPAALDLQEYILFCIVPILRLLKTLRHFELMLLLVGAFREAFKALPVLLFVWFVLTLVFSSLLYMVESRVHVKSLPHSMWFVIVTLSTVGYGDMVPETGLGSMVATLAIISGVLYSAIPIGLISQIFADIWKDRHRILFLKRLKKCLHLHDIRAVDVDDLFAAFDDDNSGVLDSAEWKDMMLQIRMDLRGGGRLCGFHYFVADGDGITPKRFVRVLWPDLYHEVFRKTVKRGMSKQSLDSQGQPKEPTLYSSETTNFEVQPGQSFAQIPIAEEKSKRSSRSSRTSEMAGLGL